MGSFFFEPLIPIIGVMIAFDSDFSGVIRFPNNITKGVVAILLGIYCIIYALYNLNKSRDKEVVFNQQPQLFDFSEKEKKIARLIYLVVILVLGGIDIARGIYFFLNK